MADDLTDLAVGATPRRAGYLGPPEMYRLDNACRDIRRAFDAMPYLVGSVLERRDFRDVDVRLMLPDEQFDELFPNSALRVFIGFAIGSYLREATGLPIDFQVQRATEANARHDKPRIPLGVRNLWAYVGDGGESHD